MTTEGTGGRILGLDVGEARIGVALSDELRMIAQPHCVLRPAGHKQVVKEIVHLVARHAVSEIVVGFPRNMSGAVGAQARRVLTFARCLEGEVQVPVHLWDERWTTVSAERALIEGDLSRRKRREKVDPVAAALILQGFLDHRRRGGDPEG